MAKTKQAIVPETEQEVKTKAEKRKEKKEKRAQNEAMRKEHAKKRLQYTAAALAMAGGAVFINFFFNDMYGTTTYEWIQIGCFVMMGLAGAIMMAGAKFEETEKQKLTKRNTGLVFIVIALGVTMMELVQMLMK